MNADFSYNGYRFQRSNGALQRLLWRATGVGEKVRPVHAHGRNDRIHIRGELAVPEVSFGWPHYVLQQPAPEWALVVE